MPCNILKGMAAEMWAEQAESAFRSGAKGVQAEAVSRRTPSEALKLVRYAPICDDKDLRVGLAGPIWHYSLLSANSLRNGCG